MAKKTGLYPATIKQEEEISDIMVDVFELPYDKFDGENPLIIHGDVALRGRRGREFPLLRNVIILGSLDIRDFDLTPDTILPDMLDELKCEYSINSLADLPEKLPAKIKKITIRRALLNNIKKDKDDALCIARRFAQAHPRIVVTDGKTTLRDLLRDIELSANKVSQPVVSDTNITPIVELRAKTDEYLSTDELLMVCRSASQDLSGISDAELTRYIKKARSAKANLKLEPVELKREDGATIICVHKKYLDTIIDYILAQIESDQARKTIKNTVKKPKKAKADMSVDEKACEKVGYQIDGKTVVEKQIKKYIPKQEWSKICKACGDDKKMLLEILRDVDFININPTDTAGKKVYYIQDGQIKTSRTLEFKSATCLSQGFKSLNSKQRIVWAVSGDVFVCIDFFPEHEHSIDEYKGVIRDARINLSKMDLASFHNVADLIRELTDGGNDGPDLPPPGTQPQDAPKADTSDTGGADDKSDAKIKKKPIDISTTNFVWTELYTMNMRLQQNIKYTDMARDALLKQMQKETSTEKLLGMADDLTKNLQRKKVYEDAISKLKLLNNQLQELKNGLEK